MEIKRSSVIPRVVVDGKEYALSFPKLKHQIMMDNIMADLNSDKPTFPAKLCCDMLVSLGLPEEVALELEPEHFLQIIEGLTNLKKNQPLPTSSSPAS
jgi:hypothetical protein